MVKESLRRSRTLLDTRLEKTGRYANFRLLTDPFRKEGIRVLFASHLKRPSPSFPKSDFLELSLLLSTFYAFVISYPMMVPLRDRDVHKTTKPFESEKLLDAEALQSSRARLHSNSQSSATRRVLIFSLLANIILLLGFVQKSHYLPSTSSGTVFGALYLFAFV